MNSKSFWQEEIRSFPHGCRHSSLWVLRRDSFDPGAPLQLLFYHERGLVSGPGGSQVPPLGAVLRALNQNREALSFPGRESALWVEPIRIAGKPQAALALLFEADETWREGVFLWGQRLAGRLAHVLGQLDPLPMSDSFRIPSQMDLFSFSDSSVEKRSRTSLRQQNRNSTREGIPLPRPLTIPGIPGAIGISEEMQQLGRTLAAVAASNANVLLRGESGTGKEVLAAALHSSSSRHRGAFVGQNCAALPEALFESELFGHRAGAFTGAKGDKKGLLAAADGGTFFLDEIGDMPLPLQIKLLRVMQERKVRRIGELKAHPVDIRFIAATHRDLLEAIKTGHFRLDLYYRLKVVTLDIPPLRQRPEDVPHLLAYFLNKQGLRSREITISERALIALQTWRWPGNVRELENEVLRWLALYPGHLTIQFEHLTPEIRVPGQGPVVAEDLGILRDMAQAGSMLEQYLIRKALAVCGGRKAQAARRLGLSRQGLYKKIARYGMADLIEGRNLPTGGVA